MPEYRVMTAADYDGVYYLWINTPGMGINKTDDSREGITAYLRRNPTTSFVAAENGRIICAILAGHDGRRGFIHHTAVLPEYRRRGIAAELVRLTMEALKAEGIKKTALLTYSANEAGNSFWEKMGFTLRRDVLYRNKEITPLEYFPNEWADRS